MFPPIPDPWLPLLAAEPEKPYYADLRSRVEAAYAAREVYPPADDLFAALRLTPPDAVRAVILGQDPYHEPGQAHGLSFSVRPGVPLPRSLQNIYRELESDLGIPPAASGCLSCWARQGVLLLNTVLTVERGLAGSHAAFGWQTFTGAVIAALGGLPQPIAFLLWGGQAGKQAELAAASQSPRLILKSAHPSPLSARRGFFGSRPFSGVNAFLTACGSPPIDWSVRSFEFEQCQKIY